jgi:hypothetical protein
MRTKEEILSVIQMLEEDARANRLQPKKKKKVIVEHERLVKTLEKGAKDGKEAKQALAKEATTQSKELKELKSKELKKVPVLKKVGKKEPDI